MTSIASNMVTQLKPITFVSGDFLTQGFDLGFFWGVGFSGPLSPSEIKSDIPNDHVFKAANDKTLVKVSTTTPTTRASARM